MARRTLEEIFSDVMLIADKLGVERTEQGTMAERAAFFAGADTVLGVLMNESMSPDERAETVLAMLMEVSEEQLRWLERAEPSVLERLRSRMQR